MLKSREKIRLDGTKRYVYTEFQITRRSLMTGLITFQVQGANNPSR
jgi:hypothetical protein